MQNVIQTNLSIQMPLLKSKFKIYDEFKYFLLFAIFTIFFNHLTFE